MTPEEIVERAAEVLVAHQRMDAGSCLCGWDELGRSHAKHQAQALADAGLLPTAVQWGVEVDDYGSIDFYDDEERARKAAADWDGKVVRSLYVPWTEVTS